MSSETPPHSSCIDAERLAAWSEGNLPAAEAAAVELHLSNCPRCQAMLAAFARSEPAAPAVLPFRRRVSPVWFVPLAAAAAVVIWVAVDRPQPSSAPVQMAARSESPVLVPDTHIGPPAPAAALLEAESRAAAHKTETNVAGPAAAPKSGAPTTASTAAEERMAVAQPMPSAPPSPPPPPPPAPIRPPTTALTGRVTDSAGGAIPGATVEITKSGAQVTQLVTDSSGRYRATGLAPGPYDVRVSLPSFQPFSRPGVEAPIGVETVVDATLQVAAASETVMVRTEPPAIQASTGERSFSATGQVANLPVANRSFTSMAPLTPAIIEIVAQGPSAQTGRAPGAAGGRGGAGGGGGGRGGGLSQAAASPFALPTRWRIPGSGAAARTSGTAALDAVSATDLVSPGDTTLGRSIDGGASWQPITIDRSVTITGGVAPSNTVCWLIGLKGVILLSTDGVRFSRVPFPEAVDLASIRATNAREASVTTADRRTFSTIDGGTTWVQGFE